MTLGKVPPGETTGRTLTQYSPVLMERFNHMVQWEAPPLSSGETAGYRAGPPIKALDSKLIKTRELVLKTLWHFQTIPSSIHSTHSMPTVCQELRTPSPGEDSGGIN